MAQWNSGISSYLKDSKTLFEVFNIATSDGKQVTYNNPFPVSLGSSSITIIGNITIPGIVSVTSSPDNPIHNHIVEVGTGGTLTVPYLPVGISTLLNTVGIGTTGQVSINVNNAPVSNANPLPVSLGTSSITVNGTVTVTEEAGSFFSFNNHAAHTNRGWTMDNTMRPVLSIGVNSTGTSVTDLMQITGYEIGNNNANSSTIVYEWYEGDLTLSGAAIPSWTSFGTRGQYRIYQDVYSSNTGNTFTVPVGTYMRHSGIIIGKNSEDDKEPEILYGGATPNMLTLCMRRVDNNTKLDVWFAITCKELA